MPIKPMLTPRPKIAVPMGRPIARTDPKAISKMMTAASRPSSSLSGNLIALKIWPPYSMVTPGTSTWSPRAWMSSARAMNSVWVRLPTEMSANAIGAVALICAAPSSSYGLVTRTPSILATSAKNDDIASFTAASSMPCGALNTICAGMPSAVLSPARAKASLYLLGLAVGLSEVGVVVGLQGAADGGQTDEQWQPDGEDHDPAFAKAEAGKSELARGEPSNIGRDHGLRRLPRARRYPQRIDERCDIRLGWSRGVR